MDTIKPIRRDEFDMGIMQNALEFLLPYGVDVDVQWFVDEIERYDQRASEFIKSLGIENMTGSVRATKDPEILE
jgi:phosphopentomutase